MGANLLAGAADADITPAIGAPMGGYGRRQGVAAGIEAPLRCHAVVVDDGTTAVGLVVCDLLFVTRDLSALVRTLVGDALGWRPEQVMVAATHTHSGPLGLTLEQDRAYLTMVARQAAGALRAAFAGRVPVRLKYAEAGVSSISQNRRHPDGPIETVARMLVADPIAGAADRDVVATVVNYACHATVLEYDNLRYSPDFPGTVVDVLRSLVGGGAVYLQGCAGNINPVWMRHDHADARRVGTILGAAAARSVSEARPLGPGQWAVNLSWYEDTAKDVTGSREVPAGPIRAESRAVALPRRARSSPSDLERALQEATAEAEAAGADQARRRALSPRRAALEAELFFVSHPGFYAGDDDERPEDGRPEQAEVQVLWLSGETAIVGLPGEPFIEIAHEIRRRCAVTNLIVAGYCNEAAGYIPTQAEFGRHGYEVGCAPFQPEAAGLLVDAAVSALGSAA